MLGLGIWEIVVVLTVALIVLGPRRLPDMARQLGKALRELRRASEELKHNLDEAVAGSDDYPPAVGDPSRRRPYEVTDGRRPFVDGPDTENVDNQEPTRDG